MRAVAARYGLTVGDVQRAVSSGMGGENIATTVEGRERYSINVRFQLSDDAAIAKDQRR